MTTIYVNESTFSNGAFYDVYEDDFDSYTPATTFPQGDWSGTLQGGTTINDASYWSDQHIESSGSYTGQGRVYYDLFSAENTISEIQFVDTGGSNVQVILSNRRQDDANKIEYRASRTASINGIIIYEFVSGSPTNIGNTNYTMSIGVVYTLRTITNGTSATVELWNEDATSLLATASGTITTVLQAGQSGFGRAASSTNASRYNNFSVRDTDNPDTLPLINAVVVINPNIYVNESTFGDQHIVTDLIPTNYENTSTFGTHNLTITTDLTQTIYENESTFSNGAFYDVYEDDFDSYTPATAFPQGDWSGTLQGGTTIDDSSYWSDQHIESSGLYTGQGRVYYDLFSAENTISEIQFVDTGDDSNNQLTVISRSQGGANDDRIEYRASRYIVYTGIIIYEYVGGSPTSIGSTSYAISIGVVYTLRTITNGTSATVELWNEDATSLLATASGTITTILTEGQSGFGRVATGGTLRYNNFSVRDTDNPDTLPLITLSEPIIKPDIYVNESTFGTHNLTTTIDLTQTNYENTSTFGTHSIDAAAGSELTPTIYENTSTFGNHHIIATLTPDIHVNENVFGSHSLVVATNIILTNGTVDDTIQSAVVIGVDTDTAGGTIWWIAQPKSITTASGVPTAVQIKLGNMSDNNTAPQSGYKP